MGPRFFQKASFSEDVCDVTNRVGKSESIWHVPKDFYCFPVVLKSKAFILEIPLYLSEAD